MEIVLSSYKKMEYNAPKPFFFPQKILMTLENFYGTMLRRPGTSTMNMHSHIHS